MKEYDLDTYQRKYRKSLTVLEHEDVRKCWYIHDVAFNEDGKPVWIVEKAGRRNQVFGDPIYHRVLPGIYPYRDTYVALWRKIYKSFKIGVSSDNYNFHMFPKDEPFVYSHLDILTPLELDAVKKEEALKKQGPVSKRIYIDNANVWYLGEHIGFRKGSRFFVNNVLCQELSDALRGMQCSIEV